MSSFISYTLLHLVAANSNLPTVGLLLWILLQKTPKLQKIIIKYNRAERQQLVSANFVFLGGFRSTLLAWLISLVIVWVHVRLEKLENISVVTPAGQLQECATGCTHWPRQRAKQYTQVICFAPLLRMLVCRTGVIDAAQTALPMRQRGKKKPPACTWPIASVASIAPVSVFFVPPLN